MSSALNAILCRAPIVFLLLSGISSDLFIFPSELIPRTEAIKYISLFRLSNCPSICFSSAVFSSIIVTVAIFLPQFKIKKNGIKKRITKKNLSIYFPDSSGEMFISAGAPADTFIKNCRF